jgi:hypothetical protein
MNPNFLAPIEVQRLQSQVLHLQSQLMLGQAIIQQKDATLEAKDALIAQIRGQTVFEQAQVHVTQKTADKDRQIALLKNTVHLKRLDLKGVEIDLPTIYELTRAWILGDHADETLATYLKQHGLKLFEDSTPALPPSEEA